MRRIAPLDVLLVVGTLMGAIGFALITPLLMPLVLMVVCYVLAAVAWRAS